MLLFSNILLKRSSLTSFLLATASLATIYTSRVLLILFSSEKTSSLISALEFEILPKRWIVERTFGWLNRYRRSSKDYELHSESSEAMIYDSLIRLMTRRLATA